MVWLELELLSLLVCGSLHLSMAVAKLVPYLSLSDYFEDGCSLLLPGVTFSKDLPRDVQTDRLRSLSGSLDAALVVLCLTGVHENFVFSSLVWVLTSLLLLFLSDLLHPQAIPSIIPVVSSALILPYMLGVILVDSGALSVAFFLICYSVPFICIYARVYLVNDTIGSTVARRFEKGILNDGNLATAAVELFLVSLSIYFLWVTSTLKRILFALNFVLFFLLFFQILFQDHDDGLGPRHIQFRANSPSKRDFGRLRVMELGPLFLTLPLSICGSALLDFLLSYDSVRFFMIRVVLAGSAILIGAKQFLSQKDSKSIFFGTLGMASACLILFATVDFIVLGYSLVLFCAFVANFHRKKLKKSVSWLYSAPSFAIMMSFLSSVHKNLSLKALAGIIFMSSVMVAVVTISSIVKRSREEKDRKDEETRKERDRKEKERVEAQLKKEDEIKKRIKEIESKSGNPRDFLRFIYENFPLAGKLRDERQELKEQVRAAIIHYHPDSNVNIEIDTRFCSSITSTLNEIKKRI